MFRRIVGCAALGALFFLPACRSAGGHWDSESASAAVKIEVQMDKRGAIKELEYHIAPEQVPAAVRAAMDELHPGGPFTDAEKEWEGRHLYYELSRKVKGMEVEAMFEPDGTLHSEEVQVAMNLIPSAVRETAMAAVSGGRADKWEEIRNGKREIVEYHVKLSRGGDRFKVMVATDGKLLGLVREVPSEIEVPVE